MKESEYRSYSDPIRTLRMEETVKIDIFSKALRQNNFGVFWSSGGRTS